MSRPVLVHGAAARDGGDLPRGVALCRAALALDPLSAEGWTQFGDTLRAAGRAESAARAFAVADRLASGWPEPGAQLALVLFDLGRNGEAVAEADRAYARAPGLQSARAAAAWACAARAAAAPDRASARAAAAKLAPLADAAPEAVTVCARSLVEHGEAAAAVEALEGLLRRRPRVQSAREALAALRVEDNARWRCDAAASMDLPADALPASLRFVAFGTTGLCNASCIHCPTGKLVTSASPRRPMPLELFRRIVGEMRELSLTVRVHVAFGLFGDGLADPHVCERARLLRDALPECTISVNTNGAAFHAVRHAALADVVNVISLHVESLRPEVYERLMAPLRAAAVFPKIEALLTAFPDMVDVSAPVSRLNRDELTTLKRHFLARGARSVSFPSLGRRCAEDDGVFRDLAANPRPIACGPEALEDLIVDCDGLVLACCNDFTRVEPIGDLRRESLLETLTSAARRSRALAFAEERHDRFQTCSRCEHDMPTAVE